MSKDGVFLARGSWICRTVLYTCSQLLILWLLNVVQSGDGHSSEMPRFCFNGTNKGHRLNATVYKNSHALSKIDCVVQCVYDDCCRSVNYRKSHSCNGNKNCELLHAVLSEEPENLNEDKDYDYSIVLQPKKSFNCHCFTKSCIGTERCKADYISVGCFKDTSDRAIPTLEGMDGTLDGWYSSRENAIAKCAAAARRKGYTMFAVQHGGQCLASASAPMTFNKYGKSDACQPDGKGAGWANEVYCIKE